MFGNTPTVLSTTWPSLESSSNAYTSKQHDLHCVITSRFGNSNLVDYTTSVVLMTVITRELCTTPSWLVSATATSTWVDEMIILLSSLKVIIDCKSKPIYHITDMFGGMLLTLLAGSNVYYHSHKSMTFLIRREFYRFILQLEPTDVIYT